MAAGWRPMAAGVCSQVLVAHYVVVLTLLSPLFAGGNLSPRTTTTAPQSNNHKNISDLLDDLLRGYDNSVRPNFGGPPAVVEVDIMVRSMGPISEVDMTYSMDCYFRQTWEDPRLAFQGNKETLALSITMLERIWKPDTYFYNGKQSYLHTITTPNKFVRLHQNGRVLYSSRRDRGKSNKQVGMEGDRFSFALDHDVRSNGSSDEEEDESGVTDSLASLSEHDRQLAALQELDDIIHKETYHVVPIMESRQGFTNLTANVQRISQAGRDAVGLGRACLRECTGARAEADAALVEKRAVEQDLSALRARLHEQERLTAAARADADASRGREQDGLVLLEELRAEVARQRERAQQLQALQEAASTANSAIGTPSAQPGQRAPAGRRHPGRELDLAEELTRVKDLLRNTYNDQDSIARRASFANMRATQLAADLNASQAALALEVRLKENLEYDLQKLRQEMEVHETERAGLQSKLDAARERIDLQDKKLRDAAAQEDRLTKRVEQTQRQLDRGEQQIASLQQALEQRKLVETELQEQLQQAELEQGRQRRQLAVLEKTRDAAAAAQRKYDARAAALLADKDALTAEGQELRRELEAARADLVAAEQREEQLVARARDSDNRRAQLVQKAAQQARVLRSKQQMWDELSSDYAQSRKQARQAEAERELLRREKAHLAASVAERDRRLEQAASDGRLQQHALAACQRDKAAAEARRRHLAAQLEDERGLLVQARRDLAEQREHTQDAAARLHALDAANEQLKEEAATKEKQSVLLERLLARARGEAQLLRADAQRQEATVRQLRSEAAEVSSEVARLHDQLRRGDAERAALRREAAAHLDERDVMAAMLVRRNDEAALLRDRGRLLEAGLAGGRRALAARREDVRLLRAEVLRLRGERRQLAAAVGDAPALRAELYRALQDLSRDRVRLRALEEEMTCPLNVHRWRRLEGSDPPAFELLAKVHILQKRILALSAAALRREAQLRHTEHLYMSLRRAVCPSEGMPAPHGIPRRMRIAARGRHLKALIAEVAALEAMADQKAATRLMAGLRLPDGPDDRPGGKRKAPADGHGDGLGPLAKQPSPQPSAPATRSSSPSTSPSQSPSTTPVPSPSPGAGTESAVVVPPPPQPQPPPSLPRSSCLRPRPPRATGNEG